jgi:hypothetical protein
MTTAFSWHDAYRAALLETDWTKMQERLQVAESEIQKRQHVLSTHHGGTPKERQAIANALRGMKNLRKEAAEWQNQQQPDVAASTPGQIGFLESGEPSSSPPRALSPPALPIPLL